MINIAEITSSRDNVIMLYATPDHIAREREELEKWFEERWLAIPREYALAKAIFTNDDDALAKGGSIDRIEARRLVPELLSKYDGNSGIAANLTVAEGILAQLDAMKTYTRRLEEIAALKRRSATLRFAETPCPVPSRPAGLH